MGYTVPITDNTCTIGTRSVASPESTKSMKRSLGNLIIGLSVLYSRLHCYHSGQH